MSGFERSPIFLLQTATPARAILDVETVDVIADRGYFKIEDIAACEKAGLMPHVPKPQRGASVRNGLFRKALSDIRLESGACVGRPGRTPSRCKSAPDRRRTERG